MTDLSAFSQDETELLASLPYKVGIWISYVDDQDGEGDDEREGKALVSCLRQFIKANEEKPLVSAILKESLRHEDKWAEWADQSFSVLPDIKKAVTILRSKQVPADDIKALKRALMEIGTAVARAFGEFGEFDDAESAGFFGKIMGKFADLKNDDVGHPMNVSAAEDSALEQLQAVLQNKA